MASPTYNQLIADIAYDIVAQYAPKEVPLFHATSIAYFKNPQQLLRSARQKDTELGSGLELLPFLTPIILAMMALVVEYIAGEIKDSKAVSKMFKKFRHKEAEDKSLPSPFTPAQVTRIKEAAYKKACALNVPEEQAQLLAEAVIGELVTSDT